MFAGVEEFAPVEDPCPHGIPGWLCEDLCPENGALDDEPDTAAVVDLGQAPGARLALQCQSAAAVPELLSDAEVLDVVAGTEGLLRWAAGVRTRMLAVFADRHPAGTSAAPPGAHVASPVGRWLPDEVGLTLSIPRLDALGEIARAQRFAHVLPDTLAALEHGRIDARRADAICGATAVLPDEKARAVEAAVLPKAPDATLRQLRDRVRRAIAKIDPDGEYRRHKEADTERRVSIRSLDDGMASLWFYGSAEQIEAAWQMADRLARALGPDDPRTLDQRRFDLALQVLTGRLTVTDLADVDTVVGDTLAADSDDASGNSDDAPGNSDDAPGDGDDTPGEGGDAPGDGDDTADGTPTRISADTGAAPEADPGDPSGPGTTPAHHDPPSGRTPGRHRVDPDVLADAVADALARRPDLHATVRKPLIQVVVGLGTLLGDEGTAELVGHGPLNADTARALAAGGILERLVTDPLSGTLLDQGRTTYTPSAGLNDHVRARDQVCRGPHCGRRIRDLDHHQEWAAHLGPTAEPNLFGYCQHHHQLKDAPGWQVIAHPDRSLTWISPCGRRHTTQPHDYRPYTDPPTTDHPPKPTATPTDPPDTSPPGPPLTTTDEDDPPPF